MSASEVAVKIIEIYDDAKRRTLELLLSVEKEKVKRANLLDAEDVAKILKVSKGKVYEMRRDGRLPADFDMGEDCKDRYRWKMETVYEHLAVPASEEE